MNIKDFISKNIVNHPKDIVGVAMQQYQISRPAVLKHLNALIRDGVITVTGRTKDRIYALSSHKATAFTLPITPDLQEGDVWQTHVESFTQDLPKSIQDICHYGFTEMLNNVIDHSQAKETYIVCQFGTNPITIGIHDKGIGIFKKIQDALHLTTLREGILHLTKGKFTTDPQHHSGEGIFFTSRLFDEFTIASNNIVFMRFCDDDWSVDSSTTKVGTTVVMQISKASTTTLESVFEKYTDPETRNFNKTQVSVLLAKIGGDVLISRSQAKRILIGLDKFKNIVLDFKDVSTVGQGFVDEIFRVYQNQHPDITFILTNMNENVEFMIKRGLPPETK
jgi:anti-sigma regulatory factor (Ser/Thr protein kinase)